MLLDTQATRPVEVWSAVASWISAIAAAVGVPFIVWNLNLLRQSAVANRAVMQASVDAQIYTRIDAVNTLLIQHQDIARALYAPFTDLGVPGPERELADMILTIFEQLFRQRHLLDPDKPLISDTQWIAWQFSMEREFEKPFLVGYWQQSASKRYEPDFADFLNGIVAKSHPA